MKVQQSKIESRALWYGGAVTVVTGLVGLAWFWGGVASLFGQGSIGAVASVMAALAAGLGFVLTYQQRLATPKLRQKTRAFLTTGALAFVHAAIGLLLTVVTYYLISTAFVGLQLDHWVAAVLVGLTAGFFGYASYLAGSNINSTRLATTLTVFLVSGVLASMISAPNPYWWEIHFSSLGGGHSASATAFNLTLVIGGIAIVGLADSIASDFARWQTGLNRRVRVGLIRFGVAALGLFLAGVGVFPYDTHLTLHNISAGMMTVLLILFVLSMPWLAPGFTKSLYAFCYTLFAGLLACIWLFLGVGYFNLTTAELITAGLVFVWIIVFVRHISAGLADKAA